MQPLTGLAREAAENRGSTLIYYFQKIIRSRTHVHASTPARASSRDPSSLTDECDTLPIHSGIHF